MHSFQHKIQNFKFFFSFLIFELFIEKIKKFIFFTLGVILMPNFRALALLICTISLASASNFTISSEDFGFTALHSAISGLEIFRDTLNVLTCQQLIRCSGNGIHVSEPLGHYLRSHSSFRMAEPDFFAGFEGDIEQHDPSS